MMNSVKTIYSLLLIGGIMCSGCMQEKYIFQKNRMMLFKPTVSLPSNDSVTMYKVKKAFKSRVTIQGSYLSIASVTPDNLELEDRNISTPDKDRDSYYSQYYYPDPILFKNVRNFVFFDTKPVLQALSIPLKIRPKLKRDALLDSFPSQTETGFNPALAFGWKMNLNVFNSKKDLFDRNLRQYSFTPGVFFGVSGTDLTTDNTRNPVIVFKRKAIALSPGMFFMLGYNNINIGYSIGLDYATGTGKNGWLYQGKLWHGITLGLDIIK